MSTEDKPSNVYYEERRGQIVSAFSGELQKAGFSVPDENIVKILDARRHKLIRRTKPRRRGISICVHSKVHCAIIRDLGKHIKPLIKRTLFILCKICLEVLSEEDSELLEQHRSLKKRLHSLCDEVSTKRNCSAAKIQETARSSYQTTQETLVRVSQL